MSATSHRPPRALLSARRLQVRIRRQRWLRPPDVVHVLDNLNLDLLPGEIVGFVGEPGCGRSGLIAALTGELPLRSGGYDLLDGLDPNTAIARLPPDAGLPPRRSVARWLKAAARRRRLGDPDAAVGRALQRAGIDPATAARSLRDLSPGDRRRAALAFALLADPRILLWDDFATGLGEAEIQSLHQTLIRLVRSDGLAAGLTGADPQALATIVDRLVVLSLGRVMEQGPVGVVLDQPAHPYTRALIERAAAGAAGQPLPGPAVDPANPPMGCVFHPRCPMAEAACVRTEPHLQRTPAPTHYAACHFAPRPPEA
jgi:oligopeptide/dipeptide ABC transporter, ATP-binding protein, C-terminal domain